MEISGLDVLELPVELVIDNEILAESIGAKVSEIVSAEALLLVWLEPNNPPGAAMAMVEIKAIAKVEPPIMARYFWAKVCLVLNFSLADSLAVLASSALLALRLFILLNSLVFTTPPLFSSFMVIIGYVYDNNTEHKRMQILTHSISAFCLCSIRSPSEPVDTDPDIVIRKS